MTSQCPYCGEPVRVGAAFCPNCGHTLPTTQSLLTAPLAQGTTLRERYVISRRLGGGGAGDVYLATDKGLFNRQVVVKRLKILDTDPRDRGEAERNFMREAEALAGLNNPHFPQILDFFIDGPSQYLVMEFVAARVQGYWEWQAGSGGFYDVPWQNFATWFIASLLLSLLSLLILKPAGQPRAYPWLPPLILLLAALMFGLLDLLRGYVFAALAALPLALLALLTLSRSFRPALAPKSSTEIPSPRGRGLG